MLLHRLGFRVLGVDVVVGSAQRLVLGLVIRQRDPVVHVLVNLKRLVGVHIHHVVEPLVAPQVVVIAAGGVMVVGVVHDPLELVVAGQQLTAGIAVPEGHAPARPRVADAFK